METGRMDDWLLPDEHLTQAIEALCNLVDAPYREGRHDAIREVVYALRELWEAYQTGEL
jgi:hypothetical protein